MAARLARFGAAGGALVVLALLVTGPAAVSAQLLPPLPTLPTTPPPTTAPTTTAPTTSPAPAQPIPTITVATSPTTVPKPKTSSTTTATTTSSSEVPTTPAPTTAPPETTPTTAPLRLVAVDHPTYPWAPLLVTAGGFGAALAMMGLPVLAYRARRPPPIPPDPPPAPTSVSPPRAGAGPSTGRPAGERKRTVTRASGDAPAGQARSPEPRPSPAGDSRRVDGVTPPPGARATAAGAGRARPPVIGAGGPTGDGKAGRRFRLSIKPGRGLRLPGITPEPRPHRPSSRVRLEDLGDIIPEGRVPPDDPLAERAPWRPPGRRQPPE